jgi:hypothetical protein
MAKRYVLDTSTKGTGASVVPFDKAPKQPGARPEPPVYQPPPPRPAKPRPAPPPEPRKPRRFQVVDVVSGAVLAEDTELRKTLDVLQEVRSVVDVRVSVWDQKNEHWRLLSLGEQRALWDARNR